MAQTTFRLRFFSVCLALTTAAIAGCSPSSPQQQYGRLEKAARAVPVPAGVKFNGVSKTTLEVTPLVSIGYSNPSMTCTQLHDAWVATLREHGKQIVEDTGSEIFVKASGLSVFVDLHVETSCTQATVAAEP